jgi:secreted PhoX family phosphatase
MFNATFNNISATPWGSILLVEENHRPVASHWQTLLHIVLSSTPRHYSVNGNVERLN